MVNSIDIRTLNLEELAGVVSLYPWYAGARVELCTRMARRESLSESLLEQTAPFVGSRSILHSLMRTQAGVVVDFAKDDSLVAEPQPEPEAQEDIAEPSNEAREVVREVFVAGGDYFSQEQYRAARSEEDKMFSGFAGKYSEDFVPTQEESDDSFDFCTETLAQIYLEQGYPEQAKEIYSKLSLRYPEKSVYFASLIERII